MVLAQLDLANENVNPLAKFGNLASIVNLIVPLLMSGAAVVFFVMLLIGSYTYITSAGDTEAVKKAQKLFKFSLFGFGIVLVSFLAVRVLEIILQVDILP